MSFLKDMKDVYKQTKQAMQQPQDYRGGGPPSFPQAPSAHGAYPSPQGPPPPQHSGYNPGYAPSYGPPGGQGPPPVPQGFGFPSTPAGFPSPPTGFPSPGYPSPSGPPSGYPPPSGPPPPLGPPSSAYNAPSGPPPGPPSSGYRPPSGPPSGPPPSGYRPPAGPPPGPPSSGYRPPAGPPPGPPSSGYGPPAGPPPGFPGSSPQPSSGYPGQQWHQQHNNDGGRPGQQYQQQNSGFGAPHANQYHPNGPPPKPPANVQNYGPHFQGADHRDAQPYFKYSQCTGKKKALCIGINYVGQRGELKGCINDARNIQSFLCKHFGYKPDDIVMLTDDSQNPRMRPTRENIVQAMRWLVKGASPNDSLFFHYSGHGGQTKDLDGDEGDGYDEVIYPLDYEKNGHIVDDMMHDIMVKPLPAGCRLTAIFDSCHSGSALDLPYIYSTEGKVKEPNLAAEAGQGLLSAVSSYAKGDMGGVFKSAMGLVKVAAGNTAKADKHAKATRTSPADVISWSGCKDSQTSADTSEAGKATGAMSFAFMSALGVNSQQSYQELLNNIRDILKSKYSQKPQLSSSHPMDTNLMFIC